MPNSWARRKLLVIFFGMTASGKSYLAKSWARRHGYPYFNSDVIRKELAVKAKMQSYSLGLNKGMYTFEFSRKTYDQLLCCAENVFTDEASPCVILDGSYQLRSERNRVVERFAGCVDIYFVLCNCSELITRARLQKRLLDNTAVSDGSLEVYLQQVKRFEAPLEIPSCRLLELDTNASLEYLIDRLEQFLSTSGLHQAACGNSTDNQ